MPVVVAVPIVNETVPERESQMCDVVHVGVPGEVPAATPAANVAVPVPATDETKGAVSVAFGES